MRVGREEVVKQWQGGCLVKENVLGLRDPILEQVIME